MPQDDSPAFDPVATELDLAIADVRAGRIVVLADHVDHTAADLVLAAEKATADNLNLMSHLAQGILYLCLTEERCEALGLKPPAERTYSDQDSPFRTSLDARERSGSGVSAEDRARTIRLAADPASSAQDFVRPGHVYPISTVAGGLFRRRGYAHAAIDLAHIARLHPAAVICPVMTDSGAVADDPQYLTEFCKTNQLTLVTIDQIVEYRRRYHRLGRTSAAFLPTRLGLCKVAAFEDKATNTTHMTIVVGETTVASGPIPLGVHRSCFLGDVFRSQACGCRERLDSSLQTAAEHGVGVVVYLGAGGVGAPDISTNDPIEGTEDHESRPLSEDEGALVVQMLREFGVNRAQMMPTSLDCVDALRRYGMETEPWSEISVGAEAGMA